VVIPALVVASVCLFLVLAQGLHKLPSALLGATVVLVAGRSILRKNLVEWISACRELTRSPPHLSVHLSSDKFGTKLTFVTQYSVSDFNELSGNRDNRPVVPSSFADRVEMAA
jgi:hypothetical protein